MAVLFMMADFAMDTTRFRVHDGFFLDISTILDAYQTMQAIDSEISMGSSSKHR